MIQVRQSMFETNSSSVHVLVMMKSSDFARFCKSEEDYDSLEDIVFWNRWHSGERSSEQKFKTGKEFIDEMNSEGLIDTSVELDLNYLKKYANNHPHRAAKTVLPVNFLFKSVFRPVGRHGGRVFSAEAGGAEAVVRSGEQRRLFQRQIAQTVHADDLRDLLHRMMAGDQVFLRIDIRSVIAGVQERRRGDAHMDLLCPGFPQQADDPPAGRTPDDGIVDQHNTLVPDHILNGGQLDLHLVQPVIRRDERPADVFVLDQPDPVGNAGSAAVPQGCVQPGIRHADHQIRLRRVCFGQAFPGADPG